MPSPVVSEKMHQIDEMMGEISQYLADTNPKTPITQALEAKIQKIEVPLRGRVWTDTDAEQRYNLLQQFINKYFPNLKAEMYPAPKDHKPTSSQPRLDAPLKGKRQTPVKKGAALTDFFTKEISNLTLEKIAQISEPPSKEKKAETNNRSATNTKTAKKNTGDATSKVNGPVKINENDNQKNLIPSKSTSTTTLAVTPKENNTSLSKTAAVSKVRNDNPVTNTLTHLAAIQPPKPISMAANNSSSNLLSSSTPAAKKGSEPKNNSDSADSSNGRKIYKNEDKAGRIHSAIEALKKYKEHLEGELHPVSPNNDEELNTKLRTVQTLIKDLEKLSDDINSAKAKVANAKENLSFVRHPVLKLFGIKTSAWNTTGSECVAKVEKALDAEVETTLAPDAKKGFMDTIKQYFKPG